MMNLAVMIFSPWVEFSLYLFSFFPHPLGALENFTQVCHFLLFNSFQFFNNFLQILVLLVIFFYLVPNILHSHDVDMKDFLLLFLFRFPLFFFGFNDIELFLDLDKIVYESDPQVNGFE